MYYIHIIIVALCGIIHVLNFWNQNIVNSTNSNNIIPIHQSFNQFTYYYYNVIMFKNYFQLFEFLKKKNLKIENIN